MESCHPTEHKYAAIGFLIDRLNKYQLCYTKKNRELEIIQDILENNGYSTSIMKAVSNPKKTKNDTEKTRWAKFTYVGKETRAITKIFKGTDIKVAFSTRNTLGTLNEKTQPP